MNEKYPDLSDRVKSIFIDTLFIIILMFIFTFILDKIQDPTDWIKIVFFIGIWFVYEPISMTIFGSTIGNLIMNIRVRQYKDTTKKINIFQTYIRYVFKVMLGWLSFLTINSNPKRRAIHDLTSGSVMIKL